MIAAGVPAGASSPTQLSSSTPFTVSPMVGMSGARRERLPLLTASTLIRPALK